MRVKGKPKLPRSNRDGATGDLLLAVQGGTAGQNIKANITVILSVDLGVGPTTAVCTPSTGPAINASKSANTYSFAGVTITTPGSSGTFQFTIRNMKIDASKAPGVNNNTDVTASITITPAPGDPALVPVPSQGVVATVLPG